MRLALPPLLSDPDGAAQRVAMTVIALPAERRDDALVKIYAVHQLIARLRGYTKTEAVASADDMKRRIEGTIQAIKVTGGGAGGRA